MANVPHQLHLINAHAKGAAFSLGVTVSALEALVGQYAQSNPTVQGLNIFWQESTALIGASQVTAMQDLDAAIRALEQSLSVSERAFYFSHSHDDTVLRSAHASIGAFLEQSRLAFVQRLRGLVAARAFGMRATRVDPLIMDRAGRRRQFSEFAYLTMRQILMNWLNNTKIAAVQDGGYDRFWVQDNEVEVVAVYDVVRYPELVDELFHPRAQRIVGGPYVPSESGL